MDTIRAVSPERLEVLYEPDLLPRPRYVADHKGGPLERSKEQQDRWLTCLSQAEILWDFPPLEEGGRSPMVHAPKVKWVQTTSTGVGPLVKLHGLQDSDLLVTTARGVHAGPLAEFVMLGLLAHFRGLRHLEAEQRAHRWNRWCGDEMAGKRLLIVGAGDLARGTAVLARAFRMRRRGHRAATRASLATTMNCSTPFFLSIGFTTGWRRRTLSSSPCPTPRKPIRSSTGRPSLQ